MAYPGTFQNRTRDEAKAELVEYVGGVGRTNALDRAGLAWDSAVRDYNRVAWRFNVTSTDITLVDETSEYALPDKVRTPVRCQLLDSNDLSRAIVRWFPYNEFLVARRNQVSGASVPLYYTMQNTHETGLVTFDPRPVAPFTYPTVRLFYAKWIDLQPTAGSTLDVPPDVEEGIFQLAVAKLTAKNKRFGKEAQLAYKIANELRFDCYRNHRIFGEINIRGANG